ncbi:biotin/lipoyl-containing protein [Salinispira pacifica]|uniref:Pyruvate carboxyl transferase subunit B n=1 Tax=Salinispira pacifica TaxID=1307761 RepID=V5WKT5_9SPIO|nr:biotin/lipoyl-containing protein [Salinispira pacifica]AHC16154.1 Pyruvate carboxyl transferase subunit B [Salinispira pacifica]
MKKIDVMITAFRDGFQSAYGARVLTDDFLPAVEATREAGITHFEAGGGARFQALYFYCNEDAFTMMDRFREAAGPDANLQTLSRGVNVVGLDSQPSDIIEMHARLFKKHGITTIRNFDALNDVNNLIPSGSYIHKAGLRHEVAVTLMSLPPGTPGADTAHTPEFYTATLQRILDSGVPFDSVCYKDASGTSTPRTVYESIREARKILPPEIPLRFHSHDTLGTCIPQYQAAIEAGATGIDLSMAPVSGGTCQSDVISMWHVLRGSEFDLGIDIEKMREAEEVFKDCMKDYFVPPESKTIEPLIPFSPMPGGALTANTQMLRDNDMLDSYPKIIEKMREVVKLGGFGTSVTPVSQFYFQQAFNNAIFGDWKKIAQGYGKMVLGYFGKTPFPPDPDVVAEASKQLGLEPTTKTVLELNDADPSKGRKPAVLMLSEAGIEETEENIFIAATCREKGIQYLKGEAVLGIRKKAGESGESRPAAHPETPGQPGGGDGLQQLRVQVDGQEFLVNFLPDGSAEVDGQKFRMQIDEESGNDRSATVSASGSGEKRQPEGGKTVALDAPLAGTIVSIAKSPGQQVAAGETICVLEAMKMENEVKAPETGVLESLSVARGQKVASGTRLAEIRCSGISRG